MRVLHRYLGLILALLLIISAVTGVLLALKKEIPAIQPTTIKGTVAELENWKPIHELAELAAIALKENQPTQINNLVDRLDIRPDKGVAKVLFEKDNWEVQVDGVTGAVLSIEMRYSDWIESIHDGSIISDTFKLFSMNFLGWGILILASSGFWLWYGPRRIRVLRRKR